MHRATSICKNYVIYVKMENKRFYNFQLVIYPDDVNFNKQLEVLQSYDYIYILHDKDINEETGETKKEHIHFILKFKNARTIKALSKESGVAPNNIEPIKSMTGSLKYLIHYLNDNKYQYDVNDCVSNCNLLDRLKKLVHEDISEDEKALNLYEYIAEYEGYLPFPVFFKYVCVSQQYSVYRRDSYSFSRLLDIHNKDYNNLNIS